MPLAGPSESAGATLVTLDDTERFMVFAREVPHDAVATAVELAIESHRLDPKWQESTAGVEVSIAIPVAAPEPTPGRLYTYLPLGAKAPSPFAGHLNAPFATNLAGTVALSDPVKPTGRSVVPASPDGSMQQCRPARIASLSASRSCRSVFPGCSLSVAGSHEVRRRLGCSTKWSYFPATKRTSLQDLGALPYGHGARCRAGD
ncbi:MAG: hypothetical protein WKF73_09400 [Nocardioidaceae bacterium]